MGSLTLRRDSPYLPHRVNCVYVILSATKNLSLGQGDSSVVIPVDFLRMTEGLGANQTSQRKRIPLRRISGREFC
jgi:hypothetical protein